MSSLSSFLFYLYSCAPSVDRYLHSPLQSLHARMGSCFQIIVASKKYAFGLGCLDISFYRFSSVRLGSKARKMIMYHLHSSLELLSWFRGKSSIINVKALEHRECYYFSRLLLSFGVALYGSFSILKSSPDTCLSSTFPGHSLTKSLLGIQQKRPSKTIIKQVTCDLLVSLQLLENFLLYSFQYWGQLSNIDTFYEYQSKTLLEICIFPVFWSITHCQRYQRPWVGWKKLQRLVGSSSSA